MKQLQRPTSDEVEQLTARVLGGADLVVWPDIFRKSDYEAGKIKLDDLPVAGLVLLLEIEAEQDADAVSEDPELAAIYFLFHHDDEEVAEHAAAWLREQWNSDEERVWVARGIVRNNLSSLDVNALAADFRLLAVASMAVWENGRGWFIPV